MPKFWILTVWKIETPVAQGEVCAHPRATQCGPTFASPNLNGYAERFVQTIKVECLDQFVVFGERHLDFLAREYEDHYNTVRPHQGIGNRAIAVVTMPPPGGGPPAPAEIECEARLGGLLRHYYRRAA